MKFHIQSETKKADALFLLFQKGEKLSAKTKKALGAKVTKQVEARIKAKDFAGESNQVLTLFSDDKKFKRIILLGRGEKKETYPNKLKAMGGTMASLAKEAKAKSVSILVDDKDLDELAHGFILGSYEFTRYKKVDAKAPKLSEVNFISNSKLKTNDLTIYTNASELTRNLINQTAGDLNPKEFAAEAKKVANKYKMKVTILDKKKLKQLGCGGILGVGRGAEIPPYVTIIEYKHKSKSKAPNIAFIGKGVTFDSGGLNLKPTNYIETMKQDMAGAGTVLGVMQAIAAAKLKGHFIGMMICVENAVSDRSIHPGDVLKMYNGKTVEVNNTDAEGRLILADGLAYVEKKYKPKVMLDIATLTGSVSHALGVRITGVMGSDQKLIDKIIKTGVSVHERMWQLPLDADFVKACKGDFTDLKNSTEGIRAGSTMGGAFLKNFVEKTPWVHFDIGGTAWADKPTPLTKYGATTATLRTLFELAKNI
jgi:leucyl aminopeptidase